ncbi:MAG: bifunctional adenosylcobinamide kinase/adenosylcobinamide-phosphate guanylyltransferase [Negativicutes bacterium]|jgi:adenosylcobinamide kinase/adenosylcobinamide-phosphate guanylyltransferase
MKSAKISLLTGGVRSGKSAYALQLAQSATAPFYIATGWADDEEMSDRIEKHKEERDTSWTTIEERYDLGAAINTATVRGADIIIVDCLTMWACNLMYQFQDNSGHVDDLIEVLCKTTIPVVLVTNEVGLGIVPNSSDGRIFRDALGFINQKIARIADKVIFMVAGIPMVLK